MPDQGAMPDQGVAPGQKATPGQDGPFQLYISGRFSWQAWLNGTEVGRNGLPGVDSRSEAPGLMDVALNIPPGTLRTDSNSLVLLASAHHSFVDLSRPLHTLRIVPVEANSRRLAVLTSPVMVALGLFLAAGVYFAGLAVTGGRSGSMSHSVRRLEPFWLALLCVIASGQLLAEMLRPLWAYPYPVHDLRLLAIAGFSAAFGLLSCFYVTRRLRPAWQPYIMGVSSLLVLFLLWQQPGFDSKSALAMVSPLCVALAISLWTAYRASASEMRVQALIATAALLALILPNLLVPNLFLDAIFFYLVAGFLLALLVDQVRTRSQEQADAFRETARADRLQLLIDQLEPDGAPPPLILRSAGRIEQVPIADISHIMGADGYAELHLSEGRTVLHTKSLGALESELPASFLKVHRSHIVNTAWVSALERDGSGTGSLVLKDGQRIPVSRRILPKVRQALS